MTKDEALDKKAENARELGLDYEPVIDESAAKRIATALGWKPKRTWNELTLAEAKEAYAQHAKYQIEDMGASGWVDFAAAIEAKLKEKNT